VSIGAIVLREGKCPFVHRNCATANRQRGLQRDAFATKLEVGPIDHDNGELYGINLQVNNRWGGFKALRNSWANHISQSLTRFILIIDKSQEVVDNVFSELRLLSSKDFDSGSLLCVIFAGDQRLLGRLKSPELHLLESRIRKRLAMTAAHPDVLLSCLDHLVIAAGNPALLTSELKRALAEHAVGNYRVMMIAADELLAVAADRELPRLDEKLYFETFHQNPQPKVHARKR
jgi:hypothetical protein